MPKTAPKPLATAVLALSRGYHVVAWVLGTRRYGACAFS